MHLFKYTCSHQHVNTAAPYRLRTDNANQSLKTKTLQPTAFKKEDPHNLSLVSIKTDNNSLKHTIPSVTYLKFPTSF